MISSYITFSKLAHFCYTVYKAYYDMSRAKLTAVLTASAYGLKSLL